MCGIVGLFNKSLSDEVSEESIREMTDAIRHRGPDASGVFVNGPVGIGMRRLAIIDVAGGKQPIFNEDKTLSIVFNGEIYNYRELQRELIKKGHVFQTDSDTEVILHLYEDKGEECLESLRGMFAFAIWNERNHTLFIARDRLGIKPLFWGESGDWFFFASEIKSLLTLPQISKEINWNGFDSYFTYGYIPAPLTIYKQINKLEPGKCLTIEDGRIKESHYWDLSFNDKFTEKASVIEDRFLDILTESVDLRLMSEVPLGAFLSGGIDSGLIVALMSHLASNRIGTFTMNFGGEIGAFMDESGYAQEIANKFNSMHKLKTVFPDINKAIDAGIEAFDEPFADDSLIPTFHICQEAKKDVTVILTGLGGDENFAGYERYLGFLLSCHYEKIPAVIRNRIIHPWVDSLREDKGGRNNINRLKRFVAAAGLSSGRRYQSYISILSQQQRMRLYSGEISSKIDYDYVDWLGRVHFERLEDGDLLDRALYQDIKMYLPDDILALSDRIGMHHSLELRVPFVDHKLVEFCARIPSNLKIKGLTKKSLLKKLGYKMLPKSVVNHKKQGFCSPMSSWLRNDLQATMVREFSEEKLQAEGFFNSETVSNMVEEHLSLRKSNQRALFSILMFQKWLGGTT